MQITRIILKDTFFLRFLLEIQKRAVVAALFNSVINFGFSNSYYYFFVGLIVIFCTPLLL